MNVFTVTPWNELSYSDALALQRQLTHQGFRGWMLFCCPPTITVGRRGQMSDVLVPASRLSALGVGVLEVDRGGLVTYHGPGQVIGFPIGTLQDHTGDPRGVREFICALTKNLEAFVTDEGHRVSADDTPAPGNAGVWVADACELGARRKVASVGLSFHRNGIGHGFSLNVQPMHAGFELINPCGQQSGQVASVFLQQRPEQEFEAAVARLAQRLAHSR